MKSKFVLNDDMNVNKMTQGIQNDDDDDDGVDDDNEQSNYRACDTVHILIGRRKMNHLQLNNMLD
jgi:hypothetical protein